MRKRRRRVFIRMAILFLALTLGLILCYEYGCKCHAPPDQNCIQVCGWWCCFLSDPSAVITAYGIFVAILGFWFISVQIDQGHKGLKQTRRSVDVAINQERPCLLVQSVRFVIPTGTDAPRVVYNLKNCGRTVGIVRRVDFESGIFDFGVRGTAKLGWDEAAVVYTVILPGEAFVGTIPVLIVDASQKTKDMWTTGKELVAQVAIFYRDSGGNTYHHRFTARADTMTERNEQGVFFEATIDTDKDHWEDGPWKDPATSVGRVT